MEVPHREIATAAAAKIVLPSLERVTKDTESTKKQIAAALTPVFGLRWGSQIVRRVYSKRLCDILRSPRNSKLDKANCGGVPTLWKAAQKTEPTFLASWGEWRDLIENSNLGDVAPYPSGMG